MSNHQCMHFDKQRFNTLCSGDTKGARSRVVSNTFELSVKPLNPSSLVNNPVICDHLLIEYGVILQYVLQQ